MLSGGRALRTTGYILGIPSGSYKFNSQDDNALNAYPTEQGIAPACSAAHVCCLDYFYRESACRARERPACFTIDFSLSVPRLTVPLDCGERDTVFLSPAELRSC